jgi:hypothetical protein
MGFIAAGSTLLLACGSQPNGTSPGSPEAATPCANPPCVSAEGGGSAPSAGDAAGVADAVSASDAAGTSNGALAPQDSAAGATTDSGPGATPPSLPSPTLPPLAVDNLVFGSFGDVRPANPDDTAGYPDAILGAIFGGLQAQGISIAADVGDHCFQSTNMGGSYCHDQFVHHFMQTMKGRYTGRLFPTMGNHESCGMFAATVGNCTTWSSGLVADYLADIVQPTTGQSSSPYYSLVLYGHWGTAKLVSVAANAWTAGQGTWLDSTLNVPTTYTFVIRHEPYSDMRAPGVMPSEAMFAAHFGSGTLTLSITGHTHLVQLPGGTLPYGNQYGATKAYEMIVGNGGAPLNAGPYYGYAVLKRRLGDGAIVVQTYEAMGSDGTTLLHDAPDPSFRFAVNANGTPNSSTSLP